MAQAGLKAYLKTAFLHHWNLLVLVGAAAAAVISPWPDAVLPLVAAGELAYLAGLVSRPRFRTAVDARERSKSREGKAQARNLAAPTLAQLVQGLSPTARDRFARLRARCLEMQRIASGAQGKVHADGSRADDLGGPALDRLLWMFLRLQVARQAVGRFLESTDESDLTERLDSAKSRLAATPADDERVRASLVDSIAVAELRLDNFRKATANADFMDIELDRVESKIQALAEMSVIRQDPDYLTSQVDAAAESMRHTETAIRELQTITGLTDVLEEPPPILDYDMRGTVGNEA
jgi:hypothetical protein